MSAARLRGIAALLGTAALALAGCATAPPAPAAGPELTVVTLNIYHDRDGWEQRRPLVIEGLRALQPDVIALQEVLQHETLRNQAADIAEALGHRYHFVSVAPPGDVERYGNAILTRHPVLARSERRLEPLADSRTVAHVRLDIDGTAVDVFATHLHWTAGGAAMRERQLADVLAHVDARGGDAPAILVGDFNAPVEAPELAALWPRFIDAFGAANPGAGDVTTLNPHWFGDDRRRIDHVLVERGRFEILESRLVLDAPDAQGTWPSDHFGVLARLRVLPSR